MQVIEKMVAWDGVEPPPHLGAAAFSNYGALESGVLIFQERSREVDSASA